MIPSYLYLSPEQAEATRQFNSAWDETPGNCADSPQHWVDYEREPKEVTAVLMCRGCPLLRECGDYAKVLKPTYGVWAGKVRKGGKK